MPKNPLKFARRKSSPLLLDDASTSTPAASSFRVLERPGKINLYVGESAASAVQPVSRPFSSPIAHLRGVSTDKLDVGASSSIRATDGRIHDWTAKSGRQSGGTIRSGSSGIYQSSTTSARHSSTSTLPSSVDAEREVDDEELFPRKPRTLSTFHDVPLDDDHIYAPPSSFSDRAAQATALPQKHDRTTSSPHVLPAPVTRPKTAARSPERHSSPRRERAMTTSSYASTARPDTHFEITAPGASSGFSSPVSRSRSGDRFDGPPPPLLPAAAYHMTNSPPIFHTRTHSQSPLRSSPDHLRDDTDSPYAWDRRGSTDRLMPYSPSRSPELNAPEPPPHRMSTHFGKSDCGYAKVSERCSSPALESEPRSDHNRFISSRSNDRLNRSSNFEYQDTQAMPTRLAVGSRQDVFRSDSMEDEESLFPSGSRNATPRAARIAITRQQQTEHATDSSPFGPPSRALQPSSRGNGNSTPKRMTKEQFERLKYRRDSNAEDSEEEDVRSEGEEAEKENDAERAKRMARQRQRQEANMSVYRQQMKKVTGESTDSSPSSRPGFDRSPASAPAMRSSSASIHFGGIDSTRPPDVKRGKQSDDDEEDDDVPLGILQAHGFPHSSRPASRAGMPDASVQRQPSPSGSAIGRGGSPGNLPPFARKLPADPYFGASLVAPSSREGLGFTTAPSIYGGATPGPQSLASSLTQPGGLVGVIAGEEQARASRRGSPNPATGTFGPSPVPSHMSSYGQFPGMAPRSVSMGNLGAPQSYFPSGMGPIPMMADPLQQEQMQQQLMQMQMQMQFMQNMMAMQQQQGYPGQPPPMASQQSPDYLAVPGGNIKRHSTSDILGQSLGVTRTGRAKSMLNPPTNGQRQATYAPSGLHVPISGPAPGYTPSIAPTERSNVGLPSRYRPVHVSSDNSLRSTSIASNSAAQASNTGSDVGQSQPLAALKPTIRVIDKPKGTPRAVAKAPSTTSEEEENEGWADMRKKREEKKSKFRLGKKGKEFTMDELVHELR